MKGGMDGGVRPPGRGGISHFNDVFTASLRGSPMSYSQPSINIPSLQVRPQIFFLFVQREWVKREMQHILLQYEDHRKVSKELSELVRELFWKRLIHNNEKMWTRGDYSKVYWWKKKKNKGTDCLLNEEAEVHRNFKRLCVVRLWSIVYVKTGDIFLLGLSVKAASEVVHVSYSSYCCAAGPRLQFQHFQLQLFHSFQPSSSDPCLSSPTTSIPFSRWLI